MRERAAVLARIERRRITVPAELHPLLLERLLPLLADLGGRFTPWEGYRSALDQAERFREGVSKARPGQSPHNFRPALAVDVVLHPSYVNVRPHPANVESPDLWDDETPEALAAWEALERAAEHHGLERVDLEPGERDRPHLQLPNWRSLIPH